MAYQLTLEPISFKIDSVRRIAARGPVCRARQRHHCMLRSISTLTTEQVQTLQNDALEIRPFEPRPSCTQLAAWYVVDLPPMRPIRC